MSEVKLKRANEKTCINSYLPKNLKDTIGDRKRILHNGKYIKAAYLIDITHSLIQKYVRKKDKITFNLYSNILKEKYGHYYNYYIDFLEKHQIIRLISNYSVNRKSKTYALLEESRTNIEIYENKDNILLKKYKNKYTEKYLKKMNYKYINKPIMDKLLEYLDMVDIDFVNAEKDVENMCVKETQYLKNLLSIKCLKNNDIWYKFDSYGRFHNNLTTLKSELRKGYLTIEGEYTKEIDLSNSQPLFLTKLMSKNLNSRFIERDQYNFFTLLVVKGEFYNYISNHTNIKDKKDIKSLVYKVLFGKNFTNTKENRIFKKLFPSIFKFISLYKDSKGNNKALAHELQRSESNWLFNNVLKEFIDKYPNTPFFTVHDSISVKKSDFDKLETIFDKHVKRLHDSLVIEEMV